MHNTNNMALASLPLADAPWPKLEHFRQPIGGPDGDGGARSAQRVRAISELHRRLRN